MALAPPVSSEADLVRYAQSGDRAAFGSLYEDYLGRIYDFTFGMLRNRADAEDVTAETFLKAVERLPSLKDPGAFKGWLYSIARNSALDLIESRKRSTPVAEHVETARTADDISLPDPETRAEAHEVRDLVMDASAALNPRDYSVYDLVVRQGMSSAEIAKVLGVRQAYAYILVNRLKGSVEEALEAVLLARSCRADCAELSSLLDRVGDGPSPRMRKAVIRHARDCKTCGANKRSRASVPALMQGMAWAQPAPAFASELGSKIDAHWTARGPTSGGPSTDGCVSQRVGAAAGAGGIVVLITAALVGLAAQRTIHEIETPVRRLSSVPTVPLRSLEPSDEPESDGPGQDSPIVDRQDPIVVIDPGTDDVTVETPSVETEAPPVETQAPQTASANDPPRGGRGPR